MKYYSFIFLFLLTIVFSCNENKVKYATIFFDDKNNNFDSVVLHNNEDLNLIDKAVSNKAQIGAKFERKYSLKIVYQDGTFEEYSCNGILLRNEHIYIIRDTEMQKQYLKLINSKLPSYLKQDLITYSKQDLIK